jgi:hypothetical protein
MNTLIKTQSAYLQKTYLLTGFIVLMFVHVIFTFSGFYDSDDLNYARYAAGIAQQGISFSPAADHYQLRWLTIFSTSFFYRLLGITAFTSTLSSVISFALCGILLYKIFKPQKTACYLLVMTIFFFGHSIIFYMHRLLPDSIICFTVLWMYYAYRSFSEKETSPLSYGLQFASALFLAVIAKESIIIAFPLFVLFFITDVFKKRYLSFWKYATAFSFLFLCLYIFYFKITTGSFVYRYHLLIANSYLNGCSFDQLPFINTLRRIGYQLWNAMLLNGDLLIILPALAAAIYRKKVPAAGIKKLDAFSFVFLLGCANFMSISFTSYVPLCHDPRHFIFLMPFAAIIAGPMIYYYFKTPTKFILLPLFFIVATSLIFITHGGTTKYLYLFFTLLFSGSYIIALIKTSNFFHTFYIAAFIALFALNYLIDFIKPIYPYYWDHKKLIEKTFSGNTADTATIFSADQYSGELSEFFLQFKTGNLQFRTMDAVKSANTGKLYYLLNANINPAAKDKIDQLLSSQVFIVAQQNNVYLYQLNDETLKRLK